MGREEESKERIGVGRGEDMFFVRRLTVVVVE
jgi:hypothetical protein